MYKYMVFILAESEQIPQMGVSVDGGLLDGVCWVVCPVGVSSGPKEVEQSLCCSALEPLEPHVIGLGRLGGHGANDKAMGGVVVSGDWCGL